MNVEQRQAMHKAIDGLNKMTVEYCPEMMHSEAEDLICGFLKEVGYGDAADAFESARDRVGFWYA